MIPTLTILDDNGDEGLHRDSDSPGTPAGELRRAAVLLPLSARDDGWHLQFIRRAESRHDRHSGQVAFPGGAVEHGDDSLEATALREAEEEIGLPTDATRVIGRMADYITISHYAVTPVVAIVERPFTPLLQADEVARTFTIPLDWLRQRSNFTLRAREDMDPGSARQHPVIVYEPYDNEVLWGATARMTMNFLRAVDVGHITLP